MGHQNENVASVLSTMVLLMHSSYTKTLCLSLSSTSHVIDPVLTLSLDQRGSLLQQLGQWHLASICVDIVEVIRQDHLVDIDTSHTTLDTLVEDLRDELVGAVKDNLNLAL